MSKKKNNEVHPKFKGMSRDEIYLYVYEKARAAGDKFPELTAAQFGHESGYGTSRIARDNNNPFGQTATSSQPHEAKYQSATGKTRKWRKYNSIDEAIVDHVKKWSPRYRNADNAIEAMAMIQPKYAPTGDGDMNSTYMKSIATHLKQQDYYKGDVNIPNADKNPDFYKERSYSKDEGFLIDKDAADSIWKKYNNAKDAIQYDDSMSDKMKNIKIDQLNQKFNDSGRLDIINEKIKEVNETEFKKKHNTEIDDLKDLTYIIENSDILYRETDDGQKINSMSIDAFDGSESDRFKNFIDRNPGLLTEDKNGLFMIDHKKLFNRFSKDYEKQTGKTLELFKKDGKRGKDLEIDVSALKTGLSKTFNALGESNSSSGSIGFSTEIQRNFDDFDENSHGIPEVKVQEHWKKRDTPDSTTSKEKGSTSTTTDVGVGKDREKARKVEKSDFGTNDADDYFATLLGSSEDTDTEFAYGKTKGSFNPDIVSGLILGIKGMRDANDVDIPLRKEQVSDAFRSFTADLRKKSIDGLPVEVEAAMINNLNESYQGGLENLVRSSAGNRNLVLGNQGQLEVAKNKGIMQIAIADYEAKDRAFAQYGEALKHIDKVDHTREIANHGIRYSEAIKERGDAEALSQAGFATMMEGIRYQKENAPGSANDMRRSQLMQSMFGFDPKMKDDGTGTQRGTKSYHDKNKALIRESAEETKAMHKKYNSMSGEQKKAFSKAVLETQDRGQLNGLLDYMHQNPNQDLSKMNASDIGKASTDGNFGSLFEHKEKKTLDASTLPKNNEGHAIWPAGSMVSNTGQNEEGTPLVNGQPAEFVDNRIYNDPAETQSVKSPDERAKSDAAISKKQTRGLVTTAVDNDNPLVQKPKPIGGLVNQGPTIPSLQKTIEKSRFSPEREEFKNESSPLIQR